MEVKNEPPRILFATSPTLLVLIDGEPALREVKDPSGAKLMRVVNARPRGGASYNEKTGTVKGGGAQTRVDA